jgi:hypothetical protein
MSIAPTVAHRNVRAQMINGHTVTAESLKNSRKGLPAVGVTDPQARCAATAARQRGHVMARVIRPSSLRRP